MNPFAEVRDHVRKLRRQVARELSSLLDDAPGGREKLRRVELPDRLAKRARRRDGSGDGDRRRLDAGKFDSAGPHERLGVADIIDRAACQLPRGGKAAFSLSAKRR